MSEIERAIELLEEISYNMGLERDTEYAGEAEKFNMLCDKKELIDIATEICRAELEREKNPPLTMKELSELASHDTVFGTHCFVKDVYTGKVFNALVDVDSAGIAVMVGSSKQMDIYEYGRKWLAYRYEPKGEKA